LDIWVWSAVTTYRLWGTIALVIGLLLGGIGVVPIALIATVVASEWVVFGYLMINLLLLLACRGSAIAMFESFKKRQSEMRPQTTDAN
jgi:hypothetical protein